MKKTKLGPMPVLFPHPTVIVGVDVDGQPDFVTVAWATIACATPPWMVIALNRVRHSLKGVRQTMAFSVNIPNTTLVKETDYCGIATGADTDKVKDCKFKVFYGDLKTAPLIEQCPINLECEVSHILNLGSHHLVVGKVVETYFSEDCLTDDRPDIKKVRPFAFGPGKYHVIGEAFADAFKIGWEIKPKPKKG